MSTPASPDALRLDGRIFEPSRIAIFGASPNVSQFNGKVVQALKHWNFSGEVLPINPNYQDVLGFRCYPLLDEVDGRVDAAIVATGRDRVLPALESAAARGARLGVIVSAGFGESDAHGKQLQAKLTAFTRTSGMRVVGPNCLGYMNVAKGIPLSAAAVPQFERIRKGPVGLVSHSAGLGVATVLYYGLRKGLGFSHLLSAGNEADIDLAQFVEFLVEDADTKIILAVIEQIRDYPRFCRAALRAAELKKPIIVLKVGRSEVGARMASSHTGSMTGSDEIQDGLFRQLGIVRAFDYPELCDVASILMQDKPWTVTKSPRVLALSGSGGLGTFFGDLASIAGLDLPPLEAAEKEIFKEAADDPSKLQNPIDLSGLASGNHNRYAEALTAAVRSDRYDVAVPIISVAKSYAPLIERFIEVAQNTPRTVCLIFAGGDYSNTERDLLEQSAKLPWFHTSEACIRAISLVGQYHSLRAQLAGEGMKALRLKLADSFPQFDPAAQHAIEEQILSERETTDILRQGGLPVMASALAASEDQAVELARGIGFPVALKVEAADLVHKAKAGGVVIGVREPDQVRSEFRRMAGLGLPGFRGVLVQEMAASGLELIVGAKRDPLLGMALTVGVGGVYTELFQDVQCARLPLCEADFLGMLSRLRIGRKLLEGGFDLQAVADMVMQLQQVLETEGERVTQLDMNPVIVQAAGKGCRIVDATLVVRKH